MSDTIAKPPPPPADLAKDGRKDGPGRQLWKSIVSKYVLRPDEQRILHAACRCDDAIAELRRKKAELEANPQYADMLVKGSMGQRIENPLRARASKILDDIQRQDAALAGHLAKLKLPDESGATSGQEQPRAVGARAAAQSRWGKTG